MVTAECSDCRKMEKLAWMLREKTSQTDYYADVLDIANKLGLEVYSANFEDNNISGFIEINEDTNEKKIVINASQPQARRRFTLAHEIGHYVLDHLTSGCKEYRRVDYLNEDNTEHEKQANKFAAMLLMPEQMIRTAWSIFRKAEILSAIFGVSIQAVNIRLTNLGLS